MRKAYIFGSWARRFGGERGALPRDVDVLVIGSADPNDVYRAAQNVEQRIGIEVNPIVVDETEWELSPGLLARIERGPMVQLEIARDD